MTSLSQYPSLWTDRRVLQEYTEIGGAGRRSLGNGCVSETRSRVARSSPPLLTILLATSTCDGPLFPVHPPSAFEPRTVWTQT